ncbi:MAG TPA: beta-ketoacyl-[acyl-carrier-protein] synthase family protein [Anaeromyxobacter sp.]|nr:beta-ketoacyl-[acyl-carrier-protein] synthase family protein [Anaeromyxobacter sp.]
MRRVAITGAGVVSPVGVGVPAFFAGLREARSGVGPIRAFDATGLATRIAAEVTGLDAAAAARDVPEPGRAALLRDRKSLFGLAAAREALADAFGARGPGPWHAPERVGVSVATGLEVFHLEDLAPHVQAGRIDGAALAAAVAAAPAGGHLQIPADLGARAIARAAGARALFAVNVSACAAGAQAIGAGWLAIRDGAADAVVAGGYDSMVNPLGVAGFCLLEALSRANDLGSAASRPFDAGRDGFVLGEGAGMVVLEELGAARARGATVHAELLGYGSTLDAYRVSDPVPGEAGAIAAMERALAAAGLAPGDVDYVNAHGTGTRKNDPAETRALRRVFGAAADRLPVSSTKSQIGHLIGAAGAVELVASIFALREQVLPATINLRERDPECDLDYVPNVPRRAAVRRVLSNSFGFGGQNAALVVGALREEA